MNRKRLYLVGIIPLVYQVLYTVFAYTSPETIIPPWAWLALHGITDTLFIVCPLLAIGGPKQSAWKVIGGWGLSWIDLTIAVIVGGLSVFLFQGAYSIVTSLVFHLPPPDFGLTQSAQDILPFVFWVVLVGPTGEETYFRGFYAVLFPKAWQYIVFSSSLWATLHVDLLSFIPLFLTGVVLAFTRKKTNSFYPALCIHMLLNAFALLYHFL
jgi:membrane protease YdiL (CAAX protease family)